MIERIKDLWADLLERLPKPLRNFYVVSAILFFLWMLFIDIDKIPRQIRRAQFNKVLNREVHFYTEKIKKGEEELQGLKTDSEKLERLAREKYFMHKASEDVFVIEKAEEAK